MNDEYSLVIGATSPTAQAFIKLMERDYPEMTLKLFVRNRKRSRPIRNETCYFSGRCSEIYRLCSWHSRMSIIFMIPLVG